MPLLPGKANIGPNISELHKGPQYAKTAAAHGTDVANKQAIAIAMKQAGMSKYSRVGSNPTGKYRRVGQK